MRKNILLGFMLLSLEAQCFVFSPIKRTTHVGGGAISTLLLDMASDSASSTSASSQQRRMGELTPPEEKVYQILKEIHDSGFKFRAVVVGKGAILEATAELGPKLSVSQSPSSGANLLTLASADQSFEFHVHLSQVSKVVLTSKETPDKVMRIIRILNDTGEAMSSLILADESDAAVKWFEGLVEIHGADIQL